MDQAETLRRIMSFRRTGEDPADPIRIRVMGDAHPDQVQFYLQETLEHFPLAPAVLWGDAQLSTPDFQLWVVSPEARSMGRAAQHFHQLIKAHGSLANQYLIVNEVTDGKQAWMIYREIEGALPHEAERPGYLGHLIKSRQFISIAKSDEGLVHLKREPELQSCVGLLCKRLVAVIRTGTQDFHEEGLNTDTKAMTVSKNRSQGAR